MLIKEVKQGAIIDFEKRYLNLKLLYAQRQIRILKFVNTEVKPRTK